MPRIRVRLVDTVSNEPIATVEWQLEGNVAQLEGKAAQQIEARLIRLFDSELLGRASLSEVLRKNPEWPNVQRLRDVTLNVFVQRRVATKPSPSTGSSDLQVRQCLTEVRSTINRIDSTSQLRLNELNPAAYRAAIEKLVSRIYDAMGELSQRNSEIYAVLALAGMPSQDWKTHVAQIDALRVERDQAQVEQGRLLRQVDTLKKNIENLKEELFMHQPQLQAYNDQLRQVAELKQQIETLRQENRLLREGRRVEAGEVPAEPRRPQGPI